MDKYDEKIKQRIGEAIREFEKEERLDPEVLKLWIRKRENQRFLNRFRRNVKAVILSIRRNYITRGDVKLFL